MGVHVEGSGYPVQQGQRSSQNSIQPHAALVLEHFRDSFQVGLLTLYVSVSSCASPAALLVCTFSLPLLLLPPRLPRPCADLLLQFPTRALFFAIGDLLAGGRRGEPHRCGRHTGKPRF